MECCVHFLWLWPIFDKKPRKGFWGSQSESALYHGRAGMIARGSLHVSGVRSWEPYSFTFWQNRKQRGTKNVSRYKISNPAPSDGLPSEEPHFLQRSPTSSRGDPLPPEEPQSLKVPQPSKTASPAGHQVLEQAWEGHFTFKLQEASVKKWDKSSYWLPYFLGNGDSAGSDSEAFMD